MNRIPVIDATATGINIARLRANAGLTVKDLQDVFGFNTPQAIYKWQRGTALPTVDNLVVLAAVFGVATSPLRRRGRNALERSSRSHSAIYVACSSVGQIAGLWPRRSAVRSRSRTPYGRMPESGQKGRTVNPLASACVGSNPTSPTKIQLRVQ